MAERAGGRDLAALPPLLRPPAAIAALIATTMVVVLSLLVARTSTGTRLDQGLFSALRDSITGTLGFDSAWVVGTAGDPPAAALLVLVIVVVCLVTGRRRLAVLAVSGPLVTGVITTVLKPAVGRTIHGDHLSFPSGHTAQLTGMAIVVGLLVVDLLGLQIVGASMLLLSAAVLAGGAMAWSQIAMSVHYATDTVAGFFVAVAVVPMAAWSIDIAADRSD